MALELGNLKFKVTEVNLFATREAVATSPANCGFYNVVTEPLLPLQRTMRVFGTTIYLLSLLIQDFLRQNR